MKQPSKRTLTAVVVPIQYHNDVLRIICSKHQEHELIASHREFKLLSQQGVKIRSIAKFVFDHVGAPPELIGEPIIDDTSRIALYIARISTDDFGRLLAVAITGKFIFQITVHIGMNLGLLPVTGIPLPFISYGGTSLIGDFLAIGLLQSIHIRHSRSYLHR